MSDDFYNDFYNDFSEDFYEEFGEAGMNLEESLPYLLGIYAMILLVGLAIGVVFYLLRAVGIYRMAKTMGIAYPWLAFIPIANVFTLGKLAETPIGGKKTIKYGLILLWLNIAQALSGALSVGYFVIQMANIIDNLSYGYSSITEPDVYSLVFGSSLGTFLLGALSIAYTIFCYIALYRTFKLFSPDYSVVFLVVSILFGIAEPIIIFCLRNKQPVIYPNGNFYGYYPGPQGYYGNPNNYGGNYNGNFNGNYNGNWNGNFNGNNNGNYNGNYNGMYPPSNNSVAPNQNPQNQNDQNNMNNN